MKKLYETPALECIEFSSLENTSFTLDQSGIFNNTISHGIGENSYYNVFGVGKDINF